MSALPVGRSWPVVLWEVVLRSVLLRAASSSGAVLAQHPIGGETIERGLINSGEFGEYSAVVLTAVAGLATHTDVGGIAECPWRLG